MNGTEDSLTSGSKLSQETNNIEADWESRPLFLDQLCNDTKWITAKWSSASASVQI